MYKNNKSINADEIAYFNAICKWLQEHTGLHFPPSKQASVLTRMYQLCMNLKIQNLKELAVHIKKEDIPGLKVELINMVTTNHTFFFREAPVLDYFKNEIIKHYANESCLRMWSAASSSGEESYTFAMLWGETFGRTNLRRIQILGTDINDEALAKAEAGRYTKGNLNSVEQKYVQNYFKSVDDMRYVVTPELRSTCIFRKLNLKSNPWPFSKKFQIIACRNILYYFDRPDLKSVVDRMYEVTADGGWLLTSVTESLRELNTKWKQVTAGVYRKEK